MKICSASLVLTLVISVSLPCRMYCESSAFDLAGPPVDVRVERHGKTLPISEVPNLETGDRLWIHPDLPDSQSARFLLIVAFLRGATNPPPDEWFTKVETWNVSVRQEGLFVTIPKEAQQALIFLAPETTGDFATLRAAVRGRPGAFVRAAQDLQQASLDRMRLERYLAEIKSISESDPNDLQQRSVLLAHSLKIRLDPKCFDRPIEQQALCLTQNTDQLVLDDAHSQSMVARLANGDTADLMNRLSYSQLGGGGLYSAYVGAVVDFARIMGSMHSAQYQYIPALAIPKGDSLSLKLNNPPSFRKPKSVLVVALPSIQQAQSPTLRSPTENQTYCLDRPSLLLPVEGAPVVFATHFAHDMSLRVQDRSGRSLELRLEADPAKGGFVLKSSRGNRDFLQEVTGTIHGMWGFDTFEGPHFQLETAHPERWTISPNDTTALIVGREDSLHLAAQHLACVSDVVLREANTGTKKLVWLVEKPLGLDVKVSLQNAVPEPITLEVNQYGLTQPDNINLLTYAEAAQFDRFTVNVGDSEGTLEGKRLDEVAYLEVEGIRFEPAGLDRRNNKDELRLRAQQETTELVQSELTAHLVLKDGRSFSLPAFVAAPRPQVALISKGVQSDDSASSVQFGSGNDLPVDDRIVFFIRTLRPRSFPRTEKIEVAAVDDSFRTVLSIGDNSLILQDSETAVGILDPKKVFGASAFGQIRFRPIDAAGRTGDWQPLGTLVRLPALKEIQCAAIGSKGCVLIGDNLFFLTAVAADSSFEDAVAVPDGFTEQRLELPHLTRGSFYFRLRDDPTVVQSATLPITHASTNVSSSTNLSYKSEKQNSR